eukprot:gnl/MRDRNA2_/MRDRNA2_116242_c0_seq1.p1 gnl/MRDRNA2_/MRDRNA2_116242_c0~~gnl/MRDRNA2_/MRDRNA2_116242_c0_seq1.p1  ORF type:complete len:300 (+),score=57.70 gnl/MRDRNA2_/MRDRNA2_116242_c0_seq1:86-985(+)
MKRVGTLAKHLTGNLVSAASTEIQIAQFPALSDNYGYLLHDPVTKETIAIDTPEYGPIARELENRGWTLTQIWNTHWHPDHTGANHELKQNGKAISVGPAAERDIIKKVSKDDLDVSVSHGDTVSFGKHTAEVIDVGGHTKAHIAFYLPQQKMVFVGDALFTLGCGKIFEGTAEQMWKSLLRLRSLPEDTVVYCAHEYTASNAEFCLLVEPDNAALKERAQQIKSLRAEGMPTVPTTIGAEKKTNPFLRADDPVLRQAVRMEDASDVEVFTALRVRKDGKSIQATQDMMRKYFAKIGII